MEPLERHICRVDPYCPVSMRSLYDGYCLVEAFEPGGFEFEAHERDMTWSLPGLCYFDSLRRVQ